MKNRVWLSVDTDDLQYLPSVQGHKSRSKGKSIDLANYHPCLLYTSPSPRD